MRVNIYAEEITDRIEIIEKVVDGEMFTGLRFYLELPVTSVVKGRTPETTQISGPFMHREGDDDSSAVTFWGKKKMRATLQKGIDMLDEAYKTAHPGIPEHEHLKEQP